MARRLEATDVAMDRQDHPDDQRDGVHDHGPPHGGHDEHGSETSARTLALVAAINLVGFGAEFAGGILFGSVALLSDAVHMLFDVLAYAMAFAAAYVATRYTGSERWSYGLHRLEPLSAFLNGLLLFPLVGYVLLEAWRRFQSPTTIDAGPTIAIAVAGLGVNLLSVYLLAGDEMGLNELGAFYHLLGDAGGSVAVILSTVVVATTGTRVVDPLAAVVIAALVTWSALKLLAGSAALFLQAAPVAGGDLVAAVESVPEVHRVTDAHTWRICSRITVATVHVEADLADLDATARVTDAVHSALADLGVDHATVEVRPVGQGGDRLAAHGHGSGSKN